MLRTLLLLLVLVVLASAAHLKASFSLRSRASTRLEAVVKLRNEHVADLYLLPWNTPADNLNGGQHFQVLCDGEPLEYEGIAARRISPSFSDFVQLKAGASASFVVDLSDGYDTSKPTTYTVVMNSFEMTVIVKSSNETDDALISETVQGTSQDITFESEGTFRAVAEVENHGLGHTFSGCSAAQQTSINTAFKNYGGLMLRSVNAMKTAATSELYRTWFGTYTDSRYTTVNTCISRLKTTSETGNYLFTCSAPQCSAGVIAYVYSNDATKMYLCATFFTIPATGPTSQADTMPHEISHYSATCGTGDAAYGQTNCKNLATSNPASAIKNADNYAFFSVFA